MRGAVAAVGLGEDEGVMDKDAGTRKMALERLHYYFGGEATLSYQVNEEGGVRVWLKCPFNPPHSGS